MTNEEIAEKVQHIIDCYDPVDDNLMEDLCKLRDELKPPKPEPGTVVIRSDGVIGFVSYANTVYLRNGSGMRWDELDAKWKPARILGPDEVPVKIPPVSEWPDYMTGIEWKPIVSYVRSTWKGKPTTIITRAALQEAGDE